MATNLVSTIIFGARNVDKTMNDNVARLPVAVGQTTNAVKEIAKYDKAFAKSLTAAAETTSPLLKSLQWGAEFASNHVNPLICVAGGVKVAMADDKKKEAINQAGALGVMFAAEKSYKALADYENILKIADKFGKKETIESLKESKALKNVISKLGDKKLKTLLNIAYGLGFVTASISGYNIGEKIAARVNARREIESANNDLLMTQNALADKKVKTTQA